MVMEAMKNKADFSFISFIHSFFLQIGLFRQSIKKMSETKNIYFLNTLFLYVGFLYLFCMLSSLYLLHIFVFVEKYLFLSVSIQF